MNIANFLFNKSKKDYVEKISTENENESSEDLKDTEIINTLIKLQKTMIKQKPKRTKKQLRNLIKILEDEDNINILKINGKNYKRKAII